MRLTSEVEKSDIEEANRIFEVSTIDSLKSDISITVDPQKTK
jgi:DNA replicative helicase MCM subunit Mcm2 (Cdc46/Mcm family)